MSDFVIASCGVQQLFAYYTDAVWRQHADDFADCFAADGEWKIAGMHMRGRAEIIDGCKRLLGRYERIHLISPMPLLQVTGPGEAIGRHQMTEYSKTHEGSGWLTIGVYHDRFREDGNRWRFAERHFTVKYRGPTDMSGQFTDAPDYGTFPARPAPDEPCYVRKG